MAKKGLHKGIGTGVAIGIGTAVALILSLALSLLGASLIENETTPMTSADMLSGGIRVISAALGALAAILLAGKNKLLVGFGSGGAYFALLLIITVFAFGGEFSGFLGGLLTVAAGSGIAVGATMLRKGKPKFGSKIPRYR